jgi:hypothetical protein
MFDPKGFYLNISSLLRNGQDQKAEQEMLAARAEMLLTGDIDNLKFVTNRLAHFYARPTTDDLAKAEECFLECEALSPEPGTLLQTATFQFYIRRDFPKTIAKVDELKARWDVTHNDSYYSALTLKGEALFELRNVEEASHVLEEMLAMVNSRPSRLPYGDELNFISAAISEPALAGRSRQLLRLIVPRIRSSEYIQRAQALLGEALGSEGT